MAGWLRFWDRQSWEGWRADRARWTPYASERRELNKRIAEAQRRVQETETTQKALGEKIAWTQQIGPKLLPIKVARNEQGLATIGGVAIQEFRGSGKNASWTSLGTGVLYFTDRKMVFEGPKTTEFRFDDIEQLRPGRGWIEIAVGRRKRATRLVGPVDRILVTLQESRLWSADSPPALKYIAMLEETHPTLVAEGQQLADLEAQLANLERPKRPVSPAWVPLVVVAVAAFSVGKLTDSGGPTASPLPAVTSSTSTMAGVSTTARTTTSTSPEVTTTTTETGELATLISVTDGDTAQLRLTSTGSVVIVRLIGMNAPEPGDCFADEASEALAQLLKDRTLTLETDTTDRDQFDRLLRYVYVGDVMINEAMVESGHATSYHYPPDVTHQLEIDAAQAEAQAARVGVWGEAACGTPFAADLEIAALAYNPTGDDNLKLNEEWVALRNTSGAPTDLTNWQVHDESASNRYTFPEGFSLDSGMVVVLHTGCGTDDAANLFWCMTGSAIWNNSGDTVFIIDPNGNINTFLTYDAITPSDTLDDVYPTTTVTTSTTILTTTTASQNCHPSYPTVCIPPPPPDLDCGDIPYRNFTVIGSDPHNFDGSDNDGWGCES